MRVVFAHYLSVPFIIGGLSFTYYAWEHDGQHKEWIIPFLVVAAFIWVFAPQINWWWYSKRPPRLEEGIVKALASFLPFYQKLDENGRLRFQQRLALTRMNTDFTPKNMPDDKLPPDIMSAIAAQSVIVTWNRSDYFFNNLEKVIISPGSFFSPEFPYPHFAETYAPEGCFLFCGPAVLEAFIQPKSFFNIALHEYVKAAFEKYGAPTADLDESAWTFFEKISGWSRQTIETAVGIAGLEPLPVAAVHYFIFEENFRKEMPEIAKTFDVFFLEAA